jgi:hypothetical protein
MRPRYAGRTTAWRRALAAAFVLFFAPQARAALSCEQLLAVTQAAVRYRDQGFTLTQVMAGLKEVEVEYKLSKVEFDVLQKAVSASYLSQASPEEIALECFKSGAFGKPAGAGSRRD